jgi:hypothetical protein
VVRSLQGGFIGSILESGVTGENSRDIKDDGRFLEG